MHIPAHSGEPVSKKNLLSAIKMSILCLCYVPIVLAQKEYEYIPSDILFGQLGEVSKLIEKNRLDEARDRLERVKSRVQRARLWVNP